MSKYTHQAEAAETFINRHVEAINLLDHLHDELERYIDNVAPDEVHWGHVGDMTAVVQQLKATLAMITPEQQS